MARQSSLPLDWRHDMPWHDPGDYTTRRERDHVIKHRRETVLLYLRQFRRSLPRLRFLYATMIHCSVHICTYSSSIYIQSIPAHLTRSYHPTMPKHQCRERVLFACFSRQMMHLNHPTISAHTYALGAKCGTDGRIPTQQKFCITCSPFCFCKRSLRANLGGFV